MAKMNEAQRVASRKPSYGSPSPRDPNDSAKWENIRRLRYGALVRLLRHRWGKFGLPDDDVGREDLWELLTNVSLARFGVEKKMKCILEEWAPWMQPDEAAAIIDHIKMLTIYERTPTARQLGERMRLTNVERERLALWPIKPFDMTDEELAEQRRRKNNERRKAKRKLTREEYRTASLTKQQPWKAANMSRAAWYRRRETSCDATIVFKAASQPVSAETAERPKRGCQQAGEV